MSKAAAKRGEVLIDGRPMGFVVRKSKRAKHILLHVDVAGEIEVVVPYRVSLREAERFVKQKKSWIKQALAANQQKRDEIPRRSFQDGEKLILLGESRRLEVIVEHMRKRSFYADGEGFVRVMVGDANEVREVLARWYKREARDYFVLRVNQVARELEVKIGKLVVSSAGSQWGSCTKCTGRISLHWRLLLGPKEVADYVVAHEVAHLIEANHSKRYWQIVASLDPGYKEHRKWLKRYGHTLTW